MITEEQFKIAAELLECEVAIIKAVHEVESSGAGFLPNGDIRILFEPHVFWKQLTAAGIDPLSIAGNGDILYPKWKPGFYGPYSQQHNRLQRAMKIDATAALKSASWGAFQIMGFNHENAGYATVGEMVEDYAKGEGEQLLSFSKYLMKTRIAHYLALKDFRSFALHYNGTGQVEHYADKLSDAYGRYAKA